MPQLRDNEPILGLNMEQKKDMEQKSTIILDQIISGERPSNDRSGLGYSQVQNEKGSSSKTIEQ
jgi:hypothetical protein